MDNLITFRLCDEDRKRLDQAIALLSVLAESVLKLPKEAPKTPQKTTAPEKQGNAQPEPETQKQPEKTESASVKTEAPATVTEKAPEVAPQVSVDDVRNLVVTLTRMGKKDETRAIVNEYAATVSGISPDKLGEVFGKLKALEV